MRKRVVFIMLLIVSCMLFFNKFDSKENVANFDPLKIEVGKVFEYLNYEKDMYILNYEIVDVDNDDVQDIVIVLGENTDKTDVYKNIDVILYNKSLKTFTASKLKNFEGKQPKIEMNDFDGDGLNDVAVITVSENKGNMIRIVSFNENIAKELFKTKVEKFVDISGQMLDGFKAKVEMKKLKKEFEIDLSKNKENYITSGFYFENGKLNTDKTKISSAGVYNIEFVKVDNKVGIKYTERIKGFDNLDIIDQIEVFIKYDDGNWRILGLNSESFGKII